jgi:protein-S-isoprenylcysteine O-methyltransferase Ste14
LSIVRDLLLYAAGFVFLTCNPHVNVNGLVISVLGDLYFLFSMFIEVKRFLRTFVEQYQEDMKRVPRKFSRRSYR